MKNETKNCQNCKKDFVIEQEDFNFYEKIKVPPPTFCPECRMIRKMIWRNTRSLYKRSCGLCEKSLISMYSDKDEAPVYCSECWNGGHWDQLKNSKDYNFSKSFFEQLRKLFKMNPRFYAYKLGNLINSEFTNFSKDNKNTYLAYSVTDSENVIYSEIIDYSNNSLDCYAVNKVDGCYYNVDCESNYNTHYAIESNNCIDSYFIYNCINCNNCFLSSNLRNQQYYFNNKKLSKEEYFRKLKEYKLETYFGIEKAKKEFDSFIVKKTIHKFAFIYASQNVSGDHIHNARNIKRCFDTNNSENISYSMRVIGIKDSYDIVGVGFNAEIIYESMATTANGFKDFFCFITIEGCQECEYCLILKNCSNCFGCVGLINAQYCILNKQYSKEEYFEMVEKIKQHMMDLPYVDSKGRVYKYGEFFPYDMCPFGYNETNAHDFFPLKKEEALEKGYFWRDREKRDYQITINSSDLPDSILEISDDIFNEVISCPNNGNQDFQCTSAYRIVLNELQFYRQKKLPLPRYCPNCRHYQRLKYRNPMKLWHRKCMKEGCNNEFETSYAPERPEIVYCERCYQQEVY